MGFPPEIQKKQDSRLLEIGAICAQWSYLEYILLCTLSKMLELKHETAKIVFGGLDIRPRVSMAIELARHLGKPQPLIDVLVTTRSVIDNGLLKRRNRAIHGVQFVYTDSTMAIEIHRGSDRARRELSIADLRQLTKDIHDAGLQLCAVISPVLWGVEALPHTLYEKPAPRSRKRKAQTPDQTPTPLAPRQKSSQS